MAYKFIDFANKILTYIPNDLPQLVQENGAYNLQYKGKFIHNRQKPLGEAKEIFSENILDCSLGTNDFINSEFIKAHIENSL